MSYTFYAMCKENSVLVKALENAMIRDLSAVVEIIISVNKN